jgi:hypothetical protein
LPSIIPSYVYTLFASMIVGTLLIVAFAVSTVNIKNEAQEQQLKSLAEYVATKGCELISATAAGKLAINFSLDIPSFIGNQRYWVQLTNDSSLTWVEIGYGTTPQLNEHRVSIPARASASGVYTSGSGIAVLQCYASSTEIYLKLSGGC